jgi:hypothetical protein
MEGERGNGKQLKRVRKLDDDDSSSGEDNGVAFPFQDPSQHSQDGDQESLRQPAMKKIRKWIDSDSDSDQDDTANITREEREEGEVDSASGKASEGVEGEGGRREEGDSDSEGEGALAIDLDCQSSDGEMEKEKGEGEEASIQSPVCDTVELLHKDNEEGEGERGSEAYSVAMEHGSLATLAMD